MTSSANTIALNPIKGMFAGMAFVLALACAQGVSAADRVHVAAGYNGLQAGVNSVHFRDRSSRSFRNSCNNSRRFRNFRNNQRNFRNRSNFSLSIGGYDRGFYNGGYSNYSRPLSNFARGCERVSTRSFWNGRRATVGGERCIDARGYSYIVPGSRFLIRYY